MKAEKALIERLFAELRQAVSALGYAEAERRIGINKSVLSRWFSPYRSAGRPNESYTGPPRNPQSATLTKLAETNLDPISSIALQILRDRNAIPGDFDFYRAAVSLGLDSTLPVALTSMLFENATPE